MPYLGLSGTDYRAVHTGDQCGIRSIPSRFALSSNADTVSRAAPDSWRLTGAIHLVISTPPAPDLHPRQKHFR